MYKRQDDDVIGKTKIVYLEDPEVARKTPTRSEPMKKEPIEEDKDINKMCIRDSVCHGIDNAVVRRPFKFAPDLLRLDVEAGQQLSLIHISSIRLCFSIRLIHTPDIKRRMYPAVSVTV